MNEIFQQILLDRKSDIPLYVQLSNMLSKSIEKGMLRPGSQMPGTRALSEHLGLHRQTIVKAYEELAFQGFLTTLEKKGTFVSNKLPVTKRRDFGLAESLRYHAAFPMNSMDHLERDYVSGNTQLAIDEGLPDLRLSPIHEFRRTYNAILARNANHNLLQYGSPAGDSLSIEVITKLLKETRGIPLSSEHVLITRGSQMGLFLASSLLIGNGKVGVASLNYQTANMTFQHFGGELIYVPVDKHGIDTEALEVLCRKHKFSVVYVTSHHHHPTTATLSVERRIRLLQLAEKFDFAIVEDDYDYDFHYERSPILPLVSADNDGRVVYVGGISKIIAPGLRLGFIVGPADFIKKAIRLRRIIDRQGDFVMERTLARMIATGYYQKQVRKVQKVYQERRDLFVRYLDRLRPTVDFTIPQGGLAVWCGFDQGISLDDLTIIARDKGLRLPNWRNYDWLEENHNYLRLGFASLDPVEMQKAFDILSASLHHLGLQIS